MKTEEQLRDEHEERKAYEKSEMDEYNLKAYEWECYIDSIKPIEPQPPPLYFTHYRPTLGSGVAETALEANRLYTEALERYKKDLSEWQMKRSCDAPNKPGYYRANND